VVVSASNSSTNRNNTNHSKASNMKTNHKSSNNNNNIIILTAILAKDKAQGHMANKVGTNNDKLEASHEKVCVGRAYRIMIPMVWQSFFLTSFDDYCRVILHIWPWRRWLVTSETYQSLPTSFSTSSYSSVVPLESCNAAGISGAEPLTGGVIASTWRARPWTWRSPASGPSASRLSFN
jgi:hypothetical protein